MLNNITKAPTPPRHDPTQAMVPQQYLLLRPQGEGAWVVMGPLHAAATQSGLVAELEAAEVEEHVLEVKVQTMHPLEVEQLDQFEGW